MFRLAYLPTTHRHAPIQESYSGGYALPRPFTTAGTHGGRGAMGRQVEAGAGMPRTDNYGACPRPWLGSLLERPEEH